MLFPVKCLECRCDFNTDDRNTIHCLTCQFWLELIQLVKTGKMFITIEESPSKGLFFTREGQRIIKTGRPGGHIIPHHFLNRVLNQVKVLEN